MKIRKRRHPSGNTTYQVDLGIITAEDGKKRRIQIACKTRDAAQAILDQRRDEKRSLGESALAISQADRVEWGSARAKLAEVGATLEEAVGFFLRHAKPRNAGVTFAELATQCVANKRVAGRSNDYCEGLRRLAENFGHAGFAATQANNVTSDNIEKFLRSGITPKGSTWTAKTKNVYLTDLSTIFSFGIEKRYVTLNPCDSVTRPRIKESPPTIFSPAECARLMKAALETAEDDNLGLLPYIAICLFAGVRMEECEQLTWENVNIREKYIEIPAAVAKRVRGVRRRIIGMSDNLAAWLRRSPRKEGAIPPKGLQKRMRKLRAAAELETWPNRVLRHSFASYHLAKHQNAEKTRLDMGHQDTSLLFSTYRELVRPKDAEAFWKINPE